ncbi:hypothetical protein HPHPA6_0218 [Helicobacter pylori Hp A-6]|nr:hypothetical protein HPHPA6_0218 [Helicobacter pylori Hp A-6]
MCKVSNYNHLKAMNLTQGAHTLKNTIKYKKPKINPYFQKSLL